MQEHLRRDQRVDHSVKVVEERQQVERQLDPSLSLALVKRVRVHDARRVVEPGSGHDWPVQVPVHVVGDERDVDAEREPLAGKQKKKVEEEVEDVLGEDERVEAVALVDRVLVVGLEFVERDDVEDGEEDEESVDDERHDVRKRSERERHREGGGGGGRKLLKSKYGTHFAIRLQMPTKK